MSRLRRPGLYFLSTWLLAGLLFAQLNANHKLEVHVILATTGTPVTTAVRVQILDRNGTPIAEAFTNHKEGVAEFANTFADGIYRLSIKGPNIETTSGTCQIYPTEADHREYVRVQPAKAEKSEPVPTSGNESVSVQSMGVPPKAKEIFERAMTSFAKGDLAKTKELLEEALAIYPEYARAHNNLGVLYLKEGDKTKAKQEFFAGVHDDPSLTSGYVNLAKVAMSDNDLEEAEKELGNAIEHDPSALSALVLLVSAEYGRNEYDQALANAKRVHDLAQHEPYGEVHLVAGEIYLKRNQPTEALAEFEMFLKEKPEDPRASRVQSLVSRLRSPSR